MSNFPKLSPSPTLEDLLRLKKSERPTEEFWSEFDRGLRKKQLAAIIEPKPWWLDISLLFRRKAPLATGVLAGVAAMAVIAVRTDSSGVAYDSHRIGVVDIAAVDTVVDTIKSSFVTLAGAPEAMTSESVANAEVQRVDLKGNLISNLLQSVAQESALLIGPVFVRPDVVDYYATSLRDSSSADPLKHATLIKFSVLEHSEPVEIAPVSSTAINALPEAKVEVASNTFKDTRHTRLLAVVSDAPAAVPSSLASVRDQVLHRMSDNDELYASVSRVGVRGDRFSVRF